MDTKYKDPSLKVTSLASASFNVQPLVRSGDLSLEPLPTVVFTPLVSKVPMAFPLNVYVIPDTNIKKTKVELSCSTSVLTSMNATKPQ